MKKSLLMLAALAFFPATAFSYPNGTPAYVTDAAPFCASCHSVLDARLMPEMPEKDAQKELAENKHYGAVMASAPSPYAELGAQQKEAIIKEAKFIDSNSSVTITAPGKARPNETIRASVKVKGGNGPAIGVMLIDRPLRFQSRPANSAGWAITGPPQVKGQNGQIQRDWLDKRIDWLPENLNYIIIFGQEYDPLRDIFPSGEVIYMLRAPSEPGTYPLAAAFLYGTENTDKAGFFQRPSGRIIVSDEIKVEVR